MTTSHCPLVNRDPDAIRRFLTEMPLNDLVFFTEEIFSQLTPAEQVDYDINRFCSDYSDTEGRIGFITTLLENSIIFMTQIPFSARRNPRIRDIMQTKEFEPAPPPGNEQDAPADETDAAAR